jgi:hypothetical protein
VVLHVEEIFAIAEMAMPTPKRLHEFINHNRPCLPHGPSKR